MSRVFYKRGWWGGVALAVAACAQPTEQLPAVLAGRDGVFWDIVGDHGRAEANVTQGFCFLPNHQFYAYFYGEAQREPYTWGRYDQPPQPGIVANLQPWRLRDSVLTLQHDLTFHITVLTPDTLRLVLVNRANAFVLARSRRTK